MLDVELINKENFTIGYNLLYGFYFFIVLLAAINLDVLGAKKGLMEFWSKLSFSLIVLYVILIGFREYNVGTDTSNYYLFNWQLGYESTDFELLFDWLIAGIKSIGLSFTVFLLLVSLCFFYFFYKAFKNIAIFYNTSVLFILFSFVSLFFVSSLSINVIRQGLSLALLMLAYSIWLRTKSFKNIGLILLLSLLCHTTSIIPVSIFFFVAYFGKKYKTKYFIWIYLLGIVLSFANWGLLNVAPFLENALTDRREEYLTNESEEYIVGFKPQFVAFNTLFMILFYYMSEKMLKNKIEWKNQYDILFRYFLIASFVFFMTFQIPYSDRFGLFGWITIPILSAPLFSMNIKTGIFKTTFVLFFGLIFLFFAFYGK